MRLKSQIPNLFTLLNLLTGVIGIIWVLKGDVLAGAYFVMISAIFDFFDGFAARLLCVSSEMGKELDSLADLVSFGVLPGFVLFKMVENHSLWEWLPYFTLLVPVLSAYRLAKFNLDTRQSEKFIGLPTPANALFISTLPHLVLTMPLIGAWLDSPFVLVLMAWIMAILLVLEIPLIALKFKNYSIKSNPYKYALLLLALVSVSFLGFAGIPWVILAYIILSILENVTNRP